ncbi:MAG: hypothetical protein P9M15_06740, partial [Candidatus Electryoneaceae bacterium]|nr:hypothetical protein [Candidatus Electryoneaceae bacterium]
MLIDDVRIWKLGLSNKGELIFEDNFDRKELGPNWISESGGWKIENGELVAPVNHKEAIVKFAKGLGKNLRVEYTCSGVSPEDLSAFLAVDPAKKGYDGYAFGFGASYNSYNYIARARPFSILERTMQEGFNTGVIPGRRHQIIVERNEGRLRLIRDGKLELFCEDMFADEITGRSFGFFTYNLGRFDDVKVYRLPEKKTVTLLPQYKVEQVKLYEFNKPADAQGKDARIVKFPTWEFARTPAQEQITVSDPCLEAKDATFALPSTDSAIIEFDLLADKSGSCSAELLSEDDKLVFRFTIDKDGLFFADGEDGKAALQNKIEYRRRMLYDTLALTPGKWHTFRLKYDVKNSRIDNVALLNYYTEAHNYGKGKVIQQGDYISLGGKIPFKFKHAKPAVLRFRSDNAIMLDNVLAFGPVGFKSVNQKNILLYGRTLLNLKYQRRRDPMLLKVQSLRHYSPRPWPPYRTKTIDLYRAGGGSKTFQDAARKYNEYMIRTALVLELLQNLERKAYYTSSLQSAVEKAHTDFIALEKLQERTALSYAKNFWNKTNETGLNNETLPLLDQYRAALVKQEKTLSSYFSSNAKKIPADPVYADWNFKYDPTAKKWRRNGRFEAFISSTTPLRVTPDCDPNYIIDKVRALGIQPAIASTSFVTNGAPKDGEYYNVANLDTIAENGRALMRQAHLRACALGWLQLGTGRMRFSTPLWWLEQNQNDLDIFHAKPDGTPG